MLWWNKIRKETGDPKTSKHPKGQTWPRVNDPSGSEVLINWVGKKKSEVSLRWWDVDSTVNCAQLHPTPRNPMNCCPPGSSVCGTFQARTLKRVAISYSRRSSWPRNWTCISCFFTAEPPGKPSRAEFKSEPVTWALVFLQTVLQRNHTCLLGLIRGSRG